MALSAKMQFTEQSTRYDDSPGTQKRSARFLAREEREGKKGPVNLHHGGKTKERSRRTRPVNAGRLVDRSIDRITAASGDHRNRVAIKEKKKRGGNKKIHCGTRVARM